MQENKLRVKKLKASIRDYSYIAVCLVIGLSILGKFDISVTPRGQVALAKEPETVIVAHEKFVKEPDIRVLRLREYLQENDSPLAPHAELLISESDKYGIDWTKVVAISKIESDLGKKMPSGSHNAWGLGGSKFMYFSDWEEAITYVSALLGKRYKHLENQGIKTIYCPASDGCNPAWVAIVTSTSNEILSMENK